MHRHLLAMALILATFLQGPALTYAATLGASMGDAITHACAAVTLNDGNDCEACCSHGSMPSCTAQCPLPVTAAVPLMTPSSVRVAVLRILIPDPGITPFADYDPPHPLRPPIL